MGADDDEAAAASIASLVLQGQATAGTVEMGGFDYHGRSRAQTDAADQKVGELLGKTISAAAAMQSPVMIHVYTDGGVSSGNNEENGKFRWQSDSGARSAAFVLMYDPNGRPAVKDNMNQIGAYKSVVTANSQCSKLGWFLFWKEPV